MKDSRRMKVMYKCKVCEKKFELLEENKYYTESNSISLFGIKPINEAFNCPHCGCQNIVNIAMPTIMTTGVDCFDEEKEADA